MDWIRSRVFISWIDNVLEQYNKLIKTTSNKRCKIIEINTDKDTNEVVLFILIIGIKNQVIPYSPSELIMNDSLLNEFSSADVRAITFYALQQENIKQNFTGLFSIMGQDFIEGKTVFIIKKNNGIGEFRKLAEELYRDNEMLNSFSHNDIKNIIATAVQEQSIEDFNRIGK